MVPIRLLQALTLTSLAITGMNAKKAPEEDELRILAMPCHVIIPDGCILIRPTPVEFHLFLLNRRLLTCPKVTVDWPDGTITSYQADCSDGLQWEPPILTKGENAYFIGSSQVVFTLEQVYWTKGKDGRDEQRTKRIKRAFEIRVQS